MKNQILSTEDALKVVQTIVPLIDKNVRLYSEARKGGYRRLKWAYIPPSWTKGICDAFNRAGISYESGKHPDSFHRYVAVHVPTDFKVREHKTEAGNASTHKVVSLDPAYYRPQGEPAFRSPPNRPWFVVHVHGARAWIRYGDEDHIVLLADLVAARID